LLTNTILPTGILSFLSLSAPPPTLLDLTLVAAVVTLPAVVSFSLVNVDSSSSSAREDEEEDDWGRKAEKVESEQEWREGTGA
jgi:hypothetical protein